VIAIFNYIARNKHAKQKARANLNYIATRVNKEKQKVDRALFGHEGPQTKEQAKKMIDRAPDNTLFWRLKLSADPNGEEEDKEKNLDLWGLTTASVQWLEKRLGDREIPFVGVEHDDHTDVRHVHALLLIQRQGREMLLTPEILNEFQKAATRFAAKQHERPGQAVTLDDLQQAQQGHQEAPQRREAVIPRMQASAPASFSYGAKGGSARRSREDRPACPNCGIGTVMQKLKDGRTRCANCGIVLSAGRIQVKEREVEWSR
jgi:ribosomal protein S27AE